MKTLISSLQFTASTHQEVQNDPALRTQARSGFSQRVEDVSNRSNAGAEELLEESDGGFWGGEGGEDGGGEALGVGVEAAEVEMGGEAVDEVRGLVEGEEGLGD